MHNMYLPGMLLHKLNFRQLKPPHRPVGRLYLRLLNINMMETKPLKTGHEYCYIFVAIVIVETAAAAAVVAAIGVYLFLGYHRTRRLLKVEELLVDGFFPAICQYSGQLVSTIS